jgi:hypothetical protein
MNRSSNRTNSRNKINANKIIDLMGEDDNISNADIIRELANPHNVINNVQDTCLLVNTVDTLIGKKRQLEEFFRYDDEGANESTAKITSHIRTLRKQMETGEPIKPSYIGSMYSELITRLNVRMEDVKTSTPRTCPLDERDIMIMSKYAAGLPSKRYEKHSINDISNTYDKIHVACIEENHTLRKIHDLMGQLRDEMRKSKLFNDPHFMVYKDSLKYQLKNIIDHIVSKRANDSIRFNSDYNEGIRQLTEWHDKIELQVKSVITHCVCTRIMSSGTVNDDDMDEFKRLKELSRDNLSRYADLNDICHSHFDVSQNVDHPLNLPFIRSFCLQYDQTNDVSVFLGNTYCHQVTIAFT